MGAFTPQGLKAWNDAAFSSTPLALFASWHTADPGVTGAGEYTLSRHYASRLWRAHVHK